MSNIERVQFYGDELEAVRDGTSVHVALRSMCAALGIDVESQRKKLIQKRWARGAVFITAPSKGGPQSAYALPLEAVPMWLATIEPSRVAERVRPKLERFQDECARVLFSHFFGAPRPQVIDASISNGARMGDTDIGKHEVRTRCLATSLASGQSLRRIYGFVRSQTRVGSPFYVSALDWQVRIRPLLDDLACRRIFLAPQRLRPLLPPDRRQLGMFGPS